MGGWHARVGAQSDPVAQLVRHSPVDDTHAYGSQSAVPLSTQVPSPSQVSALLETVPVQNDAAQTVPAA